MDDDSLHSLLARGRLSGAQRERALAGALRSARWSGTRRWAAVGAGAVVSLAAAATLLVQRPEKGEQPLASETSLVAKGAGGPIVSARCPDRAGNACHWGDRLIFEVEGVTRAGFLGAYADCAMGARIWYFPTPQGELPQIAPTRTPAVLPTAARIGKEHGTGTCVLHLLVLDQPLSRAAVLVAAAERPNRTDASIEVEP